MNCIICRTNSIHLSLSPQCLHYCLHMLSALESRIVLISLLLVVPITGGLATNALVKGQEAKQFSNQINGYIQPKWLGDQIRATRESLVTVNCAESLGSGFSFNFDKSDLDAGFSFKSEATSPNSSFIITNAHVVQNCGTLDPRLTAADESVRSAKILAIDVENDLALLETPISIPSLFGSYSTPVTGFWVMALGSPHNFAGSVTFGNIINRDEKLIFTTASLSPGNSGGPLIDNEGYVYGVNSGSKPVGQNFNISISVNVFCEKLIICPKLKYWQID